MKLTSYLFIGLSLAGFSVFGEELAPVAEVSSEFATEPAASKEFAVSGYYGETESSPGYRQLYFAFSEKPTDLVVRLVVTEPRAVEWEEAEASKGGEYVVRTKHFVSTQEGQKFDLLWTQAGKRSQSLFTSEGDRKELQQSELPAEAASENAREASAARLSTPLLGGGSGRLRVQSSAAFGRSLPPGFRPLSAREIGNVDSLRSQIAAGRPGVVVTNDINAPSGKKVEQMTLEMRRQYLQKYGQEPSQIIFQRNSRGETTVLGVPDRRR